MADLSNFPNGISSMGVPLIGGNAFGTTYFVDPTNGADGNTGRNAGDAFETLTYAFTQLSHYDTIIGAPGDYTGNYTTPIDAKAAFVSLIFTRTHRNGLAAWAAADTSSSPIIDIRARGWSIDGLEFNCPTSSSGVRLTKSTNGSTHRCDFTTIRNSIFTTGKYGVEVNGGGTHVDIYDCKFDQLTESGAHAIYISNTDNQLPAFWVVESNKFLTNTNHISGNTTTRGWNNSLFKDNVFDSATVSLNVVGSSAGGNVIAGNYFDFAKSAWAASTEVKGNATDTGISNYLTDGIAATALSGSS